MTNRSGLERSDSTPRSSTQHTESPNDRRLLSALLKLTDYTDKMSKAIENIIPKISLIQEELERLKISNINIVNTSIPALEEKLLTSMSEIKTEIRTTKNEKITPQITPSDKQINKSHIDETLLRFEQINNLLLKEKRENILLDRCQKFKSQNSLRWNDNLNKRKQGYWNFIKNQKKSELYDIWRAETPNYLPLKYRPKRVNDEIPEYTQSRITEAKLKYGNEIIIMKAYAKNHQRKYKDLDQSMMEIIYDLTDNDEERRKLIEIWEKDVRKQEEHSNQLWFKKEKFLKDKKHEDQQNGDSLMTQLSWNEILQQKANKRKSYNHPIRPQSKSKVPLKCKHNVSNNPYEENTGQKMKHVAHNKINHENKINCQSVHPKNITTSPSNPVECVGTQQKDIAYHNFKNAGISSSTIHSSKNKEYLLINNKDFCNRRWDNSKWDQRSANNSQKRNTEYNGTGEVLDIVSLMIQENQEPIRDLEFLFNQEKR